MVPNPLCIKQAEIRRVFCEVISKRIAVLATQAAAQKYYRISASETIVRRAEIFDQTIACPDIGGVPSPSWHSSYFEQPPSEARGRNPINIYGPAKHQPQTHMVNTTAMLGAL